jgi:hypothetical protein
MVYSRGWPEALAASLPADVAAAAGERGRALDLWATAHCWQSWVGVNG